MPVPRKRFSKKRIAKKSVRKNTRKHKKRTPRRKHRKSGKRFRFFGGFGEGGECAICFLPLSDNTNGEVFTTNCQHNFHRDCIDRACAHQAPPVCICPLCRTVLDPNPNPNPNAIPNPLFAEEIENLYRVQFFELVDNQQTREIDRVPVNVQDIPVPEINILEDYFINQIDGLDQVNILFWGDEDGVDPNGYIILGANPNNVVVNEGDIDIHTNPENIVQSATITRVPNFEI